MSSFPLAMESLIDSIPASNPWTRRSRCAMYTYVEINCGILIVRDLRIALARATFPFDSSQRE